MYHRKEITCLTLQGAASNCETLVRSLSIYIHHITNNAPTTNEAIRMGDFMELELGKFSTPSIIMIPPGSSSSIEAIVEVVIMMSEGLVGSIFEAFEALVVVIVPPELAAIVAAVVDPFSVSARKGGSVKSIDMAGNSIDIPFKVTGAISRASKCMDMRPNSDGNSNPSSSTAGMDKSSSIVITVSVPSPGEYLLNVASAFSSS
mmetsp:Transcript_2799/g.5066  ORF Transcript_2799/g.5066 Transcript_2799/m.5066 type:complete len:204 (-) Transcript_2799:285-896(-)